MADWLSVVIAAVGAAIAVLTAIAQARTYRARRHLRQATEAAAVFRDLKATSDKHDAALEEHLQVLVRYHAAAYARKHRLTIIDPINAAFEALFGIGIIVAGARITLDRPTVHTAEVLFGRYFGLALVIVGVTCACYGIVRLTQLRRERVIRKSAGLDPYEQRGSAPTPTLSSGRRARLVNATRITVGVGLAIAVSACVMFVATAPLRHDRLDAVARFAAAIPALGGFAALVLSRKTGWTVTAAALGAGAVIPVILPASWYGICVSALLGAGAVVALIGDARVSTRRPEQVEGAPSGKQSPRAAGADPNQHREK